MEGKLIPLWLNQLLGGALPARRAMDMIFLLLRLPLPIGILHLALRL
jgi:hypothetical protein